MMVMFRYGALNLNPTYSLGKRRCCGGQKSEYYYYQTVSHRQWIESVGVRGGRVLRSVLLLMLKYRVKCAVVDGSVGRVPNYFAR